MTKKEAPQLSEDDSDSNFSKTTKESNELTLNIESNIDRIFNDEDDVIGLQEERTLEINETVPKIHVNTKSLQEIEDFKKKLMKEKEDAENLQDLKLIKEVSTLSIYIYICDIVDKNTIIILISLHDHFFNFYTG